MIRSAGFTVKKWSIDQNMVNYRTTFDNHERFTRVEGYHALHFVATKNNRPGRSTDSCANEPPITKILSMREALQQEQIEDRQYGSYSKKYDHTSAIVIEELD